MKFFFVGNLILKKYILILFIFFSSFCLYGEEFSSFKKAIDYAINNNLIISITNFGKQDVQCNPFDKENVLEIKTTEYFLIIKEKDLNSGNYFNEIYIPYTKINYILFQIGNFRLVEGKNISYYEATALNLEGKWDEAPQGEFKKAALYITLSNLLN